MTPALATAPRRPHAAASRTSSDLAPARPRASATKLEATRRPRGKLSLRRPPRIDAPGALPADASTPNAQIAADADATFRPPRNPSAPRTWDRLRVSVPYPTNVQWRDVSASLLTPVPPDAPDLRKTAALLGAASIDVLLGHRNPATLRPWFATEVLGVLERRAALALRIKGRAPASRHGRIRSVHIHEVHPRAHELTLVAHDGEQFRAIAMRLEFWHGRWRVMALEIG